MRDPLTVLLALPSPYDAGSLLAFLAARAVPGVEVCDGGGYRRTVSLPGGPAVIALVRAAGSLRVRLWLSDPTDADAALAICRRIADLDTDPVAIDAALGADVTLAPLVAARPGLRLPGCADPAEIAIRAVLGQQISVAGARTLAARLVQTRGAPLAEPVGGLTHLFPDSAAIAAAGDSELAMPAARRRTVRGLAAALTDGRVVLDPADPASTRAELLALPGIGPWTADYIALRALRDPDVFLPGDLAVRKALARLGVVDPDAPSRWRPFRSYAVAHLWASLAPPP